MAQSPTALDMAKESFLNLLGELPGDIERKRLLQWIKDDLISGLPQDLESSEAVVDARKRLKLVSQHAKQLVPFQEAIFPSESLNLPSTVNPNTYVSLDAFLYDAGDEEELVKEGRYSSYYCRDCGSKNTAELEAITHSYAHEDLEFIFRSLLPSLQGKTLLDIGSRFGAVLFGAYFFSDVTKIVGLEMNSELCTVQRTLVQHFALQDRIQVIEGELSTRPDLLESADVIVLNNVFEWFSPNLEWQGSLWQFVIRHTKPGTLLVTTPDLTTSLSKINAPVNEILPAWVRPLNPTHPERVSPSELDEASEHVYLYQVLPNQLYK